MSLQSRVEALEARVEALEGERPGRTALPILVSETDICGVDPERDSRVCPDASLYRRRQGCLGIRCVAKSHQYYNSYRATKKAEAAAAVAPPRRRR